MRLIAGGQSGVATITAFSGGASAKLENVRVGTAAVERVLVTANPGTLPPSGGSTELTARVEDVSGLGLPGIPVTFTTTQGSFSVNPVTSDANGIARTTLTTSREADVNATANGKTMTAALKVTLGARTGVSITLATTGNVSAGVPVAFTVGVAAPPVVIRDVTVDFGDGQRSSLGALSTTSTQVQHTFAESGTYRVSATATDGSGFVETVATSVTILPAQPPSVIITPSSTTPLVNETVVFRAQVSGNTSAIIRYEWNFGSGVNGPQIVSTTGNQVSVSYATASTKTILVTVFQANGPTGDGFTSITVRANAAAPSQSPPK